jgi:hypothetical protein
LTQVCRQIGSEFRPLYLQQQEFRAWYPNRPAQLEFVESSLSGDDAEDDESEGCGEELDEETIARVLQKQEELGLGSDEMLLYGGDEYFRSLTNTKAYFGGRGGFADKQGSRAQGNRNTNFPSASALADALSMDPYRALDILDTERPSLKLKKKERRGQMPPELEDPDLNQQLAQLHDGGKRGKDMPFSGNLTISVGETPLRAETFAGGI